MKSKAFIYFDEFGNSHLDTGSKKGTFSHFIYTAFVIDGNDLEKTKEIRDELSKKYRQGSPLKSSKVNIENRLAIISKIKEVPYAIFSLVIDKRKIENKNLEDKTVFYKFFQRLFLTQFVEKYESFEIYFDKLGGAEFQNSLRNYILNRVFSPTLFNPDRKYVIADDKFEEPLIQLADLFSGSVGKIYCTSHKDINADKIFDAINDRLFVDFFPNSASQYLGKYNKELDISDKKVAELCLDIVQKQLQQNNISIEESELLKHLLLTFKTDPYRLAETNDLVDIIKRVHPKATVEYIREIISTLRYRGVIIVSIEGKYGYKIPNKKNDLIGYYNRYLKSIIPMLKKMRIANDTIRKEHFDIDIFNEHENLHLIQKFINVLEFDKIE
ncbi:DUF3800 domain-containing protein [Cellulophaga baltica]|uniref:DUF3800 domain-containing protein n=1 Tax=Cellulophaga baltica TaxID=76594 RepID=UPI0015F6E351|nr:DUF3800 domain-containing protein [Cellulophaga baltica]MBA6315675.1 DUF3800 domain-containing protein [Cellulophaga baltica]